MVLAPIVKGVDNRFLITLLQTTGGIKGTVGSIALYGSLPLFLYYYVVSAATYQTYRAIIFLTWATQGLIAATSDSYPIKGFHKRYYIGAAVITVATALAALAFINNEHAAIFFYAILSTAIVVVDTLVAGTTSALVAFTSADEGIMAYTSAFTLAGTLIGALVVGFVGDIDNGSHIRSVFLIALPFAVQALAIFVSPNKAIPHDAVVTDSTTVVPLLGYDDGDYNNNNINNNNSTYAAGGESSSSPIITPEIADVVGSVSAFKNVGVDSFTKLKHRIVVPISSAERGLIAWLTAVSFTFAIILGSDNPDHPVLVALLVPIIIAVSIKLIYSTYKKNSVLVGTAIFAFVHPILCVDIRAIQDLYYTSPDNCVLNGPQFNLK
jgi:hypothetical protein